MNRKESALVCILFFIYPSEDIIYKKKIFILFVCYKKRFTFAVVKETKKTDI